MATLAGYYLNPHRSQYESGATTITRRAGCTWTAGANGANAATAGAVNLAPDQVHALVKNSEETSPATPGWSLDDLAKAMGRTGVAFDNRSGQGWSAAVAALDSGLDIILQGDSDQFGNDTCSGAFDGNHAINVHPAYRVINGLRQRWINDPICPTGRWEFEYILRRYATKLSPSVLFGVFLKAVKKVATTVTTYRISIKAGATVQFARMNGSCILRWVNQKWGGKASGAPCRAPVVKKICNTGKKRTLVYVTAGVFKGKYVHPTSQVTVVKQTRSV